MGVKSDESIMFKYFEGVFLLSKNDDQYKTDCKRMSELVEHYTGIPKKLVAQFAEESSISDLLPTATLLCNTDAERNELAGMFEFMRLFETMRTAKKKREYRIGNPISAKAYFINFFADKNDKEYFAVAFLDARHRIIATKVMFTGTVGNLNVHPREILKEALFLNTCMLILSHNHLGGSLVPSPNDLIVTNQIKSSLDAVDVKLQDHIIVADDRAMSFADEGIITLSNYELDVINALSQATRIDPATYQKIRVSLNNEKVNASNEKAKPSMLKKLEMNADKSKAAYGSRSEKARRKEPSR
jgi:DNA repair protein RadC